MTSICMDVFVHGWNIWIEWMIFIRMDEVCSPKNMEDTCWDVENHGFKKRRLFYVYITYPLLNSIHKLLFYSLSIYIEMNKQNNIMCTISCSWSTFIWEGTLLVQDVVETKCQAFSYKPKYCTFVIQSSPHYVHNLHD